MSSSVLMPLPDCDFDVTEVAVPWHVLRRAGVNVVFATERGATPRADARLLSGLQPGLKARGDAVALYRELEKAPEFARPLRWAQLVAEDYQALWLAGGHAPGTVRQGCAEGRPQKPTCAKPSGTSPGTWYGRHSCAGSLQPGSPSERSHSSVQHEASVQPGP